MTVKISCQLMPFVLIGKKILNKIALIWIQIEMTDHMFLALTLSIPESIMETCSVVLTFESVDEILWCDHSNETSLAVVCHGVISFSIFYITKISNFFLNFVFLALLGGKGLIGIRAEQPSLILRQSKVIRIHSLFFRSDVLCLRPCS